MTLTGLHLLLTYRCTLECDHCFVWGSPRQRGTMTVGAIDRILDQAKRVGSVEWIYFEGGEPTLFYPVLLRGVRRAADSGFRVGIVTNAYWATGDDDALEWLAPFAGRIDDFSISCDMLHGDETEQARARTAHSCARRLGIPAAMIRVEHPERGEAARSSDGDESGEFAVRFRGRASEMLAPRVQSRPCTDLVECPFEDLREPGRLHVDPFGFLHVCQGIAIGNVFERPLAELCASYDPDRHPIVGPLLRGGPLLLADGYGVPHRGRYADACHLCYETRLALRSRFPATLGPDAMYGVGISPAARSAPPRHLPDRE